MVFYSIIVFKICVTLSRHLEIYIILVRNTEVSNNEDEEEMRKWSIYMCVKMQFSKECAFRKVLVNKRNEKTPFALVIR